MKDRLIGAACAVALASSVASDPVKAAVDAGIHPSDPMPPLAQRVRLPVVVAKIDKSEQRMRVFVRGKRVHTWKVSTAARGYRTPVGTWKPVRIHKMWYSRKYNNSPMPHSIFFYGGYAVHGTYQVKALGRPASHGCVRLHPSNARKLYSLVARYGLGNTRIVVTQ